jgi:hypothetical protein
VRKPGQGGAGGRKALGDRTNERSSVAVSGKSHGTGKKRAVAVSAVEEVKVCQLCFLTALSSSPLRHFPQEFVPFLSFVGSLHCDLQVSSRDERQIEKSGETAEPSDYSPFDPLSLFSHIGDVAPPRVKPMETEEPLWLEGL